MFNLNDMLNSDAYQMFESSLLGNDLFINDPDRASRLYEYAEDGLNGSTHAEVIQDWRDYLDYADLPEETKDTLLTEIDHVEEWHSNNGSLHSVIG